MLLIILITWISLIGMWFAFGIRPREILKQIVSDGVNKPPTMRSMIDNAVGKKKTNIITRTFKEMKTELDISNRGEKYDHCCIVSVIFSVIGGLASIILQNPFLFPVAVAIGLLIMPLYIMLTAPSYRKIASKNLEMSLSIVTNSYLRTNNLLESVHENIGQIKEPARSAFRKLLVENEYITSDLDNSIIEMKKRINNLVFKEWCDAVIECEHDSSKRAMLIPIVSKLRKVNIMQIELDAMLKKPVSDFRIMVIFAVSSYPVVYLINASWFIDLFTTIPGKIVTACVAAALLLSMIGLVKTVKPIEYGR